LPKAVAKFDIFPGAIGRTTTYCAGDRRIPRWREKSADSFTFVQSVGSESQRPRRELR